MISKRVVCIIATLTLCAASAFSQTFVKELDFPDLAPGSIVVNPILNRTYVGLHGIFEGSTSTAIAVIDGTTNTIIKTVGGDPDSQGPLAVDFVTGRVYVIECRFLQVADPFCHIRVMDSDLNTIAQIDNVSPSSPLAINPTTHRLYYAQGTFDTNVPGIAVADTRTNQFLGRIVFAGPQNPAAISVDLANNRIAVLFGLNNVALIDGHTSKVLRTTTVGVQNADVAVDPFRQRIYVTDQNSGSTARSTIAVLDSTTLALKKKILLGPNPGQIAVDMLSNRVFVTNGNNTMSTIDGTGLFLKKTTFHVRGGIDVNPVTGTIYVGTPNFFADPFTGKIDVFKE